MRKGDFTIPLSNSYSQLQPSNNHNFKLYTLNFKLHHVYLSTSSTVV